MNKEEAHSPEDVQHLYIVLRPESVEKAVEEKQDPHSGKEDAIEKGSASSSGSETSSIKGGHGNQVIYLVIYTILSFSIPYEVERVTSTLIYSHTKNDTINI